MKHSFISITAMAVALTGCSTTSADTGGHDTDDATGTSQGTGTPTTVGSAGTTPASTSASTSTSTSTSTSQTGSGTEDPPETTDGSSTGVGEPLPDLPEPTIESISDGFNLLRSGPDLHRAQDGRLAAVVTDSGFGGDEDAFLALLDGTWSTTLVWPANLGGTRARVWLTEAGVPHMLLLTPYGSPSTGVGTRLNYAVADGGGFDFTPVHPDSEPHPEIGDVAVDSVGTVHVVFRETADDGDDRLVLWHGQLQGDVFGLEIVDDGGTGVDSGAEVSLEVGPDDTLYAAFLRETGSGNELVLSQGTTGSWASEQIDTGVDANALSFDVGPEGQPHFVLGRVSEAGKHWVHDDGGWEVEAFADASSGGADISVDRENSPHVVIGGAVEYWRNGGGGFEMFDGDLGSGGAAIEVDADRLPHIVVRGAVELSYVHFDG